MSTCDPSLNAAVPAWLTPIGNQLTPAMQQQAAVYANDGSVPQNTIVKAWAGNLPIAYVTNCHQTTILPDGTSQAGLYHGTSVWLITDPSQYPPAPIDWGMVAATGTAAAVVVAAFFLALRSAGRIAH